MDLNRFSKLQFYSVGIVAVNKLLSENFVEVIPIEHTTFMEGELTDRFEEFEAQGEASDGTSFDVKIDTTLSVRAEWLPLCVSNRITSPDVRRGEHVALYKFGDDDGFYWTTLRQDKHIRRLETAIFSFSNNRDENIEDDPETTYWFEISTHKKIIHLHTSKNDDEPFIYDVQINTKDGRVVIQDDDSNYIFLDSAERHIRVHNKDMTYIEADKRIINMHAYDEINMTTDKFTLVAKESIDTKTKRYNERCDDYTLEAKDSITTETKEHKVGNENFKLHTQKDLSQTVEGKTLFKTPMWEYKVGVIKFDVKTKFHVEIDPGVDVQGSDASEPPEKKILFKGAPIDHDDILTTTYVPGPAEVPPVEIKGTDTNKSDVEPKESDEPKEVPAL
jgi:hypothetical protein